jgi:hypothetical protein
VPVPFPRGRWLATFVLAIAAAACRKESLIADAGATLPMGRAGRPGSDDGGGRSGAGGLAARGGAGGNDDGGATGLGGIGQCTGGGAAVCTPAGVAGPTGGVVGGFCTMEGATCALFDCHGVLTGNVTCCQGQWRALAGTACPGPLKPGDPFVCIGGSASCIAGQSYCYSFNKAPTPRGAPSCRPLCPAGDCSCFCDNPDGCDFAPADGDCEADRCNCSAAVDSSGVVLPGGVAVGCTYADTTSGNCYVAAERPCSGITYAVYCTGPRATPPSGCTPLSDDVAAPACRATESHYYCCPA